MSDVIANALVFVWNNRQTPWVELFEIPWSVRTRKCFSRNEITCMAELLEFTADKLLETRNFGETGVMEIRDNLAKHHLRLRGE